MQNTNPLLLQQHSMWSAFTFDLLDNKRMQVGTLEWPNFAQAKNARLRFYKDGSHKGDVRMVLRGVAYLIRFEYITRNWANDIRFTLEAETGAVLASLDLVHQKQSLKRPLLTLTAPVNAGLVKVRSLPKIIFNLVLSDAPTSGETKVIGSVKETGIFSLKRELVIDVPSVSEAVKGFIGFVALNVIVNIR